MLTDVADYLSVVPGYGIVKLVAPSYIVNEKLSDVGFGQGGKWEIAVILIQRDKEILISPIPKEVIQANDILILAGSDDKIEKLLVDAKKQQNNGK